MAVIAKVFIVLGSIGLASAGWLVVVQPDFYYSVNLPFKETVALFKSIKQADPALKVPAYSYNGKTIAPKDTALANREYHLSYFNPEEQAIYQVVIYQDGLSAGSLEETSIRFNSIIYLDNGNAVLKPSVREPMQTKQNKIIRKRFNNLVLNKVKTRLDSLSNVQKKKLEIYRNLL